VVAWLLANALSRCRAAALLYIAAVLAWV